MFYATHKKLHIISKLILGHFQTTSQLLNSFQDYLFYIIFPKSVSSQLSPI